MSSRQIYCIVCNCYLGEIRDAKLLIGIKHLCPNCDTKRVASDMANKTKADARVRSSVPDFLKDIFGVEK
ncbi:hypothetical protein LCGC14_1109610 [marine sediment metagenome]|uniref:Uncharacterized protein n=1 Tax=marine sediment metagenome TaxID=412755 RepID=A0A0F9MBW4_9ZZZZ